MLRLNFLYAFLIFYALNFMIFIRQSVDHTIFYFIFLTFLGPYLRHVEVPRLVIELELQLLAYTTATATGDPSCICDLHHSSLQSQILNPLSGAMDQTCILLDTSQIRFPLAMAGTRYTNVLIDF